MPKENRQTVRALEIESIDSTDMAISPGYTLKAGSLDTAWVFQMGDTSLTMSRVRPGRVRPRQRFADEKSLTRHRNALPVGFQHGVAAQIVVEEYARIGKFLRVVTGLGHRAIGRCGALLQPFQSARLAAAIQHAAAGGQMIRGGPRKKMQPREFAHLGFSREVADDIRHVARRRGVQFNCVNPSRKRGGSRRVGGRPYIARRIVSPDE